MGVPDRNRQSQHIGVAMSLFTSPQIINDGTADRSFTWRGQVPDPKSIVSEYFEPAASPQTTIRSKYEVSNSPTQRNVISTTGYVTEPVSGEKLRVTINTSVAHAKSLPLAEVEKLLELHTNALELTGFKTRFLQRQP